MRFQNKKCIGNLIGVQYKLYTIQVKHYINISPTINVTAKLFVVDINIYDMLYYIIYIYDGKCYYAKN